MSEIICYYLDLVKANCQVVRSRFSQDAPQLSGDVGPRNQASGSGLRVMYIVSRLLGDHRPRSGNKERI